jgi:steroid delta-isomerase-like uncharacterized protein
MTTATARRLSHINRKKQGDCPPLSEVWGHESLAAVDELAGPSLSVSYPILPDVIHGPETLKQFLTGFHTAFPDANVTLEEIAERDKVVVRWKLRGTHQGGLLGIPTTGKQVEVSGMTIYRIADGKIVEERGEEDASGLRRQLGVIPAASGVS